MLFEQSLGHPQRRQYQKMLMMQVQEPHHNHFEHPLDQTVHQTWQFHRYQGNRYCLSLTLDPPLQANEAG